MATLLNLTVDHGQTWIVDQNFHHRGWYALRAIRLSRRAGVIHRLSSWAFPSIPRTKCRMRKFNERWRCMFTWSFPPKVTLACSHLLYAKKWGCACSTSWMFIPFVLWFFWCSTYELRIMLYIHDIRLLIEEDHHGFVLLELIFWFILVNGEVRQSGFISLSHRLWVVRFAENFMRALGSSDFELLLSGRSAVPKWTDTRILLTMFCSSAYRSPGDHHGFVVLNWWFELLIDIGEIFIHTRILLKYPPYQLLTATNAPRSPLPVTAKSKSQ